MKQWPSVDRNAIKQNKNKKRNFLFASSRTLVHGQLTAVVMLSPQHIPNIKQNFMPRKVIIPVPNSAARNDGI
jgi:hypothetical protein